MEQIEDLQKSMTKDSHARITNAEENFQEILQTKKEFPEYNTIIDSLQFQNDLNSGSYIHDIQDFFKHRPNSLTLPLEK